MTIHYAILRTATEKIVRVSTNQEYLVRLVWNANYHNTDFERVVRIPESVFLQFKKDHNGYSRITGKGIVERK